MSFINRFPALCSPLAICCTILCSPLSAKPIAFVQQGQLLVFDGTAARTVEVTSSLATSGSQNRVSDYWGALADGRLVVSLEANEARDSVEDQDHHCSTHAVGEAAWLVSANGALDTLLCTNVLRAYPAPKGETVALVSPERELSIWQNDKCTSVSAPGKVSNAGWSPDGRHLVVSVYPPYWTQGAVSEASTTAEFLRLQNADLYLFDVTKMEFVSRLTDDPGTEYGAFFSPDGLSLYYNWLHLTEDEGGVMRLNLDKDDRTSASMPAVKLTRAGNDEGETPLGRVATYVWQVNSEKLVFESGLPDGSGEIWMISSDGTGTAKLASGRKPQALRDEAVAYISRNGVVEVVRPEAKP